jgi:hypothetical protein
VDQTVTRRGQATAADLISVAGHSPGAAPNIYGLLPVASGFPAVLARRVKIAHIYPGGAILVMLSLKQGTQKP